MPQSLVQPPVPLPTLGQPPMNIPPPPPPPPVGIPLPVCQSPVVHPVMGQPPILTHPPMGQMAMNQPVISQQPLGLPSVPTMTPPSMPITVRADLMPPEEADEVPMDQQECSNQEPECEPPAPGTEEIPMEEHAPSPSKFLLIVSFNYDECSLKYGTTILIVVMSA